ncbi:MAG: GGDEF domain-containing protein [Eubacteriales bacterium]|nr:GGDEF domain-containing protein [Eubacteriales bacterium]MDD3866601.1 GGDEF domain-containing protein [Eubacteriales bacterium]MDD4462017.1 GGDEF domain-containing protein [Eubacteriales bacterium]
MKELRPSDLAYRVILMICSAFIFLSLPLLSTSVQGRSDLADPLIFLGNEQLAPIIYQERGITKGIVVDISRAISEKTGRPIEVHAMNWEEAQRQVLSGEADALLQINPNPDRKTNFDFSEEILASEFSLFIRNGNMHIRTMDDLTDRAVGVEPGGYPHILVQNDESIKIEIITDWTSGFQMVANGEIDAILVDRWIGEYQLAQSSSQDITVVNEPVEISSSRIAVRKGDWELLDMINSGLQSIKFKHFNDTYGHLVGDDALKHVADVIRNYVRRSGDLVARYGGEEFIIMLMDATEDDAAQIAENIRHSVERTDIQTDGHTAHLTVSVGIAAVLPDPRQRSENLINAADQAMYLAKESGRNRVIRAGGYHSSMGLTGQP